MTSLSLCCVLAIELPAPHENAISIRLERCLDMPSRELIYIIFMRPSKCNYELPKSELLENAKVKEVRKFEIRDIPLNHVRVCTL